MNGSRSVFAGTRALRGRCACARVLVPRLVGCALALVASACDTATDLKLCDIRETACQDDIFYAVQRMRGVPWDPWVERPDMRTITAEAYLEELLEAEARRQMNSGQGGKPAFDHYTAALELLGMINPDRAPTAEAETRVDNVAAFYTYADKRVTIIDHGTPLSPEWATQVLAHELVHAAQDRELDLTRFSLAQTHDGDLARQAVVEGEARLYELLVSIDAQQLEWSVQQFDDFHARVLERAKARVFEDESPVFQIYGLLYPLGAHYLTDRYVEGGNVAVRDVWADLPRQVRELMATREWTPLSPGDRTPLPSAPALACGRPQLPEPWALKAEHHMGALNLFAVATRLLPDVESAWRSARAWTGDHLLVYGDEAEHTLLLWHLRFEPPALSAFVDGARQRFGEQAVFVDGDRVSLLLYSAEMLPEISHFDECDTES